MKVAYVDTSCLVAIAFGEPSSKGLRRRLSGFDDLVSSGLMVAELRSAFEREKTPFVDSLVAGIGRVLPDRQLDDECKTALAAGYLRGADLWHVACALFVARAPDLIHFITLDKRQADIVKKLGFLR